MRDKDGIKLNLSDETTKALAEIKRGLEQHKAMAGLNMGYGAALKEACKASSVGLNKALVESITHWGNLNKQSSFAKMLAKEYAQYESPIIKVLKQQTDDRQKALASFNKSLGLDHLKTNALAGIDARKSLLTAELGKFKELFDSQRAWIAEMKEELRRNHQFDSMLRIPVEPSLPRQEDKPLPLSVNINFSGDVTKENLDMLLEQLRGQEITVNIHLVDEDHYDNGEERTLH